MCSTLHWAIFWTFLAVGDLWAGSDAKNSINQGEVVIKLKQENVTLSEILFTKKAAKFSRS